MILIAHRGNMFGPNNKLENNPDYLMNTINAGFNVELDLWLIDNQWWLGHDEPTYKIDYKFITNDKMWIHCKNYSALQKLIEINSTTNFFYHTDEDYVLTSKKYIWAHPGKIGSKYTICVMPEWNGDSIIGFAGVCSDYVGKIDNDKINFI